MAQFFNGRRHRIVSLADHKAPELCKCWMGGLDSAVTLVLTVLWAHR